MGKRKRSLFDQALGSGRRKSRGGLATLGAGKSSKRAKRSAWDRAFSSRKRKAKDRGLSGAINSFGSRTNKGGDAFAGGLGTIFDQGAAFGSRSRSMANTAAEHWTRRLTPTERLEAEQAARIALEDEELQAKFQDETLAGNESFIRRLVNLVSTRVRLFWK